MASSLSSNPGLQAEILRKISSERMTMTTCMCLESQTSTSGRTLQQHQRHGTNRHAGIATRRNTLFLLVGATRLLQPSTATAKEEEDSLYALGEINNTLNACPLNSPSCISSQNDDQFHFAAPWQYDGSMAEACNHLLRIATGGKYDAMVEGAPGLPGISRVDAAAFILEGFGNTLRGERLPERPQRQLQASPVRFDGVLADRHTTEDGSEYLHIIFNRGREPAAVIDAEFLFLTGDNIVDIWAGSRGRPGLQDAQVGLSFSEGVVYDRNIAKRRMEELRKALQWETAPVLTDFDPRYNNKRLLWFERLYQPFLGQNYRVDEEPIYDK
ncbi:hypothetical protein COCOBI_10-3820 [Coccomyxa sp. Obi]|nr:hypothetical protein COCOBI_10-3820 [Coccomyxa sp. Obi]